MSDNRSHMIGNRKEEAKPGLRGVRSRKINNISCFIHYYVDEEARTCSFEIHTRLRPGHITCVVEGIDPETFDLDKEISKLRLNMDEKQTEAAGSK